MIKFSRKCRTEMKMDNACNMNIDRRCAAEIYPDRFIPKPVQMKNSAINRRIGEPHHEGRRSFFGAWAARLVHNQAPMIAYFREYARTPALRSVGAASTSRPTWPPISAAGDRSSMRPEAGGARSSSSWANRSSSGAGDKGRCQHFPNRM